MSVSEATGWLREFLLHNQPSLEAEKYGSHSCKCTLLTWAGRSTTIIFSPTERRLLGHCIEPALRSTLIYSRESFTSLYAKVLKLFTLIRSREFEPDLPAIDRVLQYIEGDAGETSSFANAFGEISEPMGDPAAAQEDALVVDSDTSDGSDIETHCLTLSSGFEERPDFPGVPASAFKVHCKSGLRHVLNEDSFLLCGRQMSSNFRNIDEVSSVHHIESCSQANVSKSFRDNPWSCSHH